MMTTNPTKGLTDVSTTNSPKRGIPVHGHISKAAEAWRNAHLNHGKRAAKAVGDREQKLAAAKGAGRYNQQAKGK